MFFQVIVAIMTIVALGGCVRSLGPIASDPEPPAAGMTPNTFSVSTNFPGEDFNFYDNYANNQTVTSAPQSDLAGMVSGLSSINYMPGETYTVRFERTINPSTFSERTFTIPL